MKTIGLIGGMSWESSKVYYEYVNQMVKEQLGGSHSAKVVMTSVDFAEIEKLTFQGHWDKIGAIIANEAIKLEKAGADMVLLCTNTIHMVSDYITNSVTIPFYHIAEATGEAIKTKGIRRIALLGTKFTMEKDFYTKILKKTHGLEVVIPKPNEREIIHNIIYQELIHGMFTKASKEQYITIINRMKKAEDSVEGVIFGCTEIPLLVAPSDVAIPTFNTTKIHAQKAVTMALSK